MRHRDQLHLPLRNMHLAENNTRPTVVEAVPSWQVRWTSTASVIAIWSCSDLTAGLLFLLSRGFVGLTRSQGEAGAASPTRRAPRTPQAPRRAGASLASICSIVCMSWLLTCATKLAVFRFTLRILMYVLKVLGTSHTSLISRYPPACATNLWFSYVDPYCIYLRNWFVLLV